MTDVINIVYQPCNGVFEKIKSLNITTPDYFVKKMLRYYILNTLSDKQKIIDIIWKHIIVIIYFLNDHLKSFDAVKKVLRNSQNIISERKKCADIKTEGVNVFSDSSFDDCIFGAIQNLLSRISGLSEKYLNDQNKIDDSAINLAVSIILNSNKHLGKTEEKEIPIQEEPTTQLFEEPIFEDEKTINMEGEDGEISYTDILADEEQEEDEEQDYPDDEHEDEDEYNVNDEEDSGQGRGYDDPTRPNPRLARLSQEYDPELNWQLDDNIEYTPPSSPLGDSYDPELNWQLDDNLEYTPPSSPGYNPPMSPGYNPPMSPMTGIPYNQKTDFSEFLNEPNTRMQIYLLNSYPGLEFEKAQKLSTHILNMVRYINDHKIPKRIKINRINFFN